MYRRLSLFLLPEKKFMNRRFFTFMQYCFVMLLFIAEKFSLLSPVGV